MGDINPLKKTYDKLYTNLSDELAENLVSDYSLSSFSQGLKYFFSYLTDNNIEFEDIDRDTVWGFIQERYSNGNSMDTISQYLERVCYVLENSEHIEEHKRIKFLFRDKFVNAAIMDIAENTEDRSFGNYKKNINETTLSSEAEKLKEVFNKFHPRG
jgi:hypothetical protein